MNLRLSTETTYNVFYFVSCSSIKDDKIEFEYYGESVESLEAGICLLENARIACPNKPWNLIVSAKRVVVSSK